MTSEAQKPQKGRRRQGQNLTEDEHVEAKAAFLDAFAQTGIMLVGCQAAGVHHTTLYRWLEHDEEFSLAYKQAEAQSNDVLRAEIYRRGKVGYDKPVYQGGKMVGTVHEYSDTLLIFLAKARMPEFRDRVQIDHSYVDAEAERISRLTGVPAKELLRRVDELLRERRGGNG